MVNGVRFCFFAAGFFAVVVFLPSSTGIEGQIKKYVYNNNGFGTYSFEFETIDGTFRKEDGGVTGVTKDGHGLTVRGEYGYIDPEGQHHLVKYVADANGYQPRSDDIRFNDRRII